MNLNIQKIISTQAIIFIITGLLFTLYSPLVFAWLGLTAQFADSIEYWIGVSFARLFGAALCGWGMIILSAHRGLSNLSDSPSFERPLLLSILVADLLLAFVSAIQTASVWGTSRSWFISVFFLMLAIFSLVPFLLSSKSKQH